MGDVDAEAIAQELVAKKAPLLREEIMQLAFYLPDQGQHKAAGERGSAFFAGAYRHGGITRLRASCRSWPWSIQAITKYIHPAEGAGDRVHVFRYPLRSGGETPSGVIKLSDFQGGGLWIEDPLGQDARDIDGRMIPGSNTDFDQDVIVFNAKEALHMTLPWEGIRVVLAVYSVQGVDRIPADEFEQLMQLGFNPAPVQTGDHADAPWQIPTFALRTEAADRKRPHGGFAIIVSATLARKRSLPATK